MEQEKKLKVAIITHFSTKELRDNLPLNYKRRLYVFFNRLFGEKKSIRDISYGDISPWVTNTIFELEKRSDIELYVISAHTGMKKMVADFVIRNTHYFFFNTDFTLFLKRIIKNDDLWRTIEPNTKNVNKIVKKIKPDVINLIGADGAYFSTTILGIENIPVYVSMQTVYSNPLRKNFSDVDSKNWTTEVKIHKKEKYFGCTGKMHYDLLLNNNPNAIVFSLKFPATVLPKNPIPETEKIYDFVTFAQNCSKSKGTFDAIAAIAILKNRYPTVTLNVCGARDEGSTQIMDDIIHNYNLEKNIVFTDFFEKQIDLFHHLKKARFAVLPIKLDIISSTVSQAMALGLPVVTNITSGTPKLNKEKQCVLLCKIGDIEDLAQKMMMLLEDENLANKLRVNAHEYQLQYNNPTERVNKLVEDLYAVYNHYHFKKEIPDQLLYEK